jgi:hypothetical protein
MSAVGPTRRTAAIAALVVTGALASGSAVPLADVEWTTLAPTRCASVGGATFTAHSDGSLLVSGASTASDTYTLEFESLPKGVTALRLDVLTDPSLPLTGPGRGTNGNFLLSELRVGVGVKGAKRPKPVTLTRASASFSQDGLPCSAAIDGVPSTSWSIAPKLGQPQHLVVETKSDLQLAAGQVLTVEMDFGGSDKATLGRFKLSATSAPRPVRADGPKDEANWGSVQERINTAIDRGCEWLVQQQLIDGSWEGDQTGYRNGSTSLVLYALLKSGVKRDHPAVVRALEWLKTGAPRETYTLGCQLLALAALDDPKVEPWMKELADALARCQQPNGGFNYGPGTLGATDLSNSQYGALGLRAAAMHGGHVAADVWEKLAAYVLTSDDEQGGGAYAPLGFRYHADSTTTGSMTAAGVGILAICDEQLHGKSRTGGLRGLAKRGATWIGRNFVVDANPRGDVQWVYYWLYGVERVGALLDMEELDGHRWYREGAKWLVERQDGDGKWPNGNGPTCSTSWALLFLTRATAVATGRSTPRATKNFGDDDPRRPVSVRASGDTPLSFWISSFGEAQLDALEWPGESGRGPRVRSVEWFATSLAGSASGTAGDEPPLAIARVERDGTKPAERDRFGGQWSFTKPGRYALFAKVTVLAPPAAGASAATEQLLESPRLEVRVDEVNDPELLRYATDSTRNLLATARLTTHASSQHDDWEPKRAVDGLMVRGWASRDDDPKPKFSIELEKPVRANVLLFTPMFVAPDRNARMLKLAVTLNGKGPPLELPVVQDRARKTKLRLPTPALIRRIDVDVLDVRPSDNTLQSVGFAEIEAQMETGAKR